MSEIISDQRFKNVELSGEIGLRLTSATGTIKHSGSGNLTIKTTNRKLILHATNSSTGAIEFIGPQGNIIMNTSGITIGSSNTIITMASINNTFNNDVNILGNLTVSGNTVSHNVQTYTVNDPILGLANGQTTPLNDIGFIGFRGNDTEKIAFIWDESEDRFATIGTHSNNNTTLAINSYKDLCVKDLLCENLTGTLNTSSQPNITFLGTLTTLSVESQIAINGSTLSGAKLHLKEASNNGSNGITIQAPSSLSSSYTLILPTTNGTPNQVLQTDGNGILSWFTLTSGITSISQANDINISDPINNQLLVFNNGFWENTSNISISSLTLDGTTITANATELNVLDGITASTTELNVLDGITASTTELNVLDGITASTTELNVLDGITASTAELNVLNGITASTAELNVLDGITASTAELNVLDGITASTTELNVLDGITASTTELNVLDGITASTIELNVLDGITSSTTELNYVDITTPGTVDASKALVVDVSKDLTGLNNLSMATLTATGITLNGNLDLTSGARDILLIDNSSTALEIKESGNTYLTFDTTNTTEQIILGKSLNANSNNITNVNTLSASSLTLDSISITASATELNVLDGITASTTELNVLDGITASTTELNVLDGITASTTELNVLDGITASTTELNYVDITTPGTVDASKALVVDVSKDLTGLNNLSMATLTTTGITLNGNLDLTSGSRDILLIDNSSTALEIKESGNTYLTFDTTNTTEQIILGKSLNANSNNITGITSLSATTLVGTLTTGNQPNITSLGSSVMIIGQESSGGKLILRESTNQGTNQITIKAPATLGANYSLVLPTNDGNSNNYLKTDGSGVLSWDYPVYVGVVSDIKSATTDGGESTSGTWHTRVLNTKSETNSFITLSSNRITLDVGTYQISASAPCYKGNQHQLKLVNITGNTTAILGQSAYASSLYNVQNNAILEGIITPGASTTYELQHYITNGVLVDGLGRSVSSGESEVYTVVKIYKLN